MDTKNKDTTVILRRAPGIVTWSTPNTNGPVRGMWMMEGILYAVVGGNLYSINPLGQSNLLGSGIIGEGRVHMTDNSECLVIIIPGTTTAYTYSQTVTTTAITFTSPPTGTTGNLQTNWTLPSGEYGITFSDGEYQIGLFENSAQTIGWETPLTGNPTATATVNTGFGSYKLQQLTNPAFTFYGALNCAFIDAYIVFLALNGREFFNSDAQVVSGTGPVTFTTAGVFPREFGTDLFVGMAVDHRQVIMFGQLTSEVYIDTGNSQGTPFSSAPNNFMEIGCAAGETIAKQDQSVFWLANDRTVRRMNGVTPVRVSNHGIEAILEQAYIADAYGFQYSIGGHLFYVLTLPTAGRTLAYDCTTSEWHELSSAGIGYWRPFCAISAYGMWLVGDSQSGQIGYVDTQVFTEFGSTRTAIWTHQPVYVVHQRLRHNRFEVILGTGKSPLTGQGSNPLLTLQISDDGGNTFRTMPTKTLGLTGEYLQRAVWYRLGMSRERVYQLSISDPVETWVVDATVEVSGAKN